MGLRSANLFRCNAGPRDEARSCTGNSPRRFFLSGPRVRATQASEGSPSGIMCQRPAIHPSPAIRARWVSRFRAEAAILPPIHARSASITFEAEEQMSTKELNRYRGCLLGLAAGDALGTTLEFDLPSHRTSEAQGRQLQERQLHRTPTGQSNCR